jgi:hypothetical protein
MSSQHIQHPRQSTVFSPDTIERILHLALADLHRNEPDIDSFSSETNQTEWNLVAHLAPEIVKYFESYSYDLEVTKVNHGNRRPDIIIHRRGSGPKYNLLVVEVKRGGSEGDMFTDAKKIQDHWFSEGLQYQFGATINLKPRNLAEISVFPNRPLRETQSR